MAVRFPAAPRQPEFNRILGLTAIEQLDELRPLYADAPFWVSLDPRAQLDGALLERGFTPAHPWQKFERGVEPHVATSELEAVEARTPDDFGETLVAGYGLQSHFAPWAASLVRRRGWHCFVAYDGETPAGAGALFTTGGLGWLGAAATRPEQRGRGAQGAILGARIARARELGLSRLVTETGVPVDGVPGASYRNIMRCGFRRAYVRPNYAAPAG